MCETSKYTLTVGSTKSSDEIITGVTQKKHPSKIFVHANYSDQSLGEYDIALFKMSSGNHFDIREDFKVNTVCLPTEDMGNLFKVDQNVTVTGWDGSKTV